MRIKPHKALSAGEDSQWWFREVNDGLRAAGAITKDGNNAMYMYEGGYAVLVRSTGGLIHLAKWCGRRKLQS